MAASSSGAGTGASHAGAGGTTHRPSPRPPRKQSSRNSPAAAAAAPSVGVAQVPGNSRLEASPLTGAHHRAGAAHGAEPDQGSSSRVTTSPLQATAASSVASSAESERVATATGAGAGASTASRRVRGTGVSQGHAAGFRPELWNSSSQGGRSVRRGDCLTVVPSRGGGSEPGSTAAAGQILPGNTASSPI